MHGPLNNAARFAVQLAHRYQFDSEWQPGRRSELLAGPSQFLDFTRLGPSRPTRSSPVVTGHSSPEPSVGHTDTVIVHLRRPLWVSAPLPEQSRGP